MSETLRRWFLRLRYEHAQVSLLTLRAEIGFAQRWITNAQAHVEHKQDELERMRRDLDANESLWSLARRGHR